MRILAFGDNHGNIKSINRAIEKSKSSDVILCTGDITNFGQGIEKVLLKFKKINKPFLIIPGNHEFEDELKKVCKKLGFPIFLHKGSYRINNYVFFGYGGGGFSQEDLRFERITEKFKKTIKKGDKIILITHAPPYKTKLDFLPGIGHTGNESYTKAVKELKPDFYFCGHLHENQSKRDKINKTILINPGPEGKLINI